MPQSSPLPINWLDPQLVSALIGALIGGALALWTTRWFERRRNAVELYASFTSPDMESVRHDAGQILESNKLSATPLSLRQMHSLVSKEDLSSVTRLLNFWERTEHLLASGYVSERFVRRSLRHYLASHLKNHLGHFHQVCESKDTDSYREWTRQMRSLASRWQIAVVDGSCPEKTGMKAMQWKMLGAVVTLALTLILAAAWALRLWQIAAPVAASSTQGPTKEMELFINFLTNMAGAGFGALAAAGLGFWFALKTRNMDERQSRERAARAEEKARVDQAFEMHREFNSNLMFRARVEADNALKPPHIHRPLQAIYSELPVSTAHALFLVIRFYERLWLEIQSKRLELTLVPKLFGEVFIWWYEVCFKHQLNQSDWGIQIQINELHAWMERHAPQADLDKWRIVAGEDRQRRITP